MTQPHTQRTGLKQKEDEMLIKRLKGKGRAVISNRNYKKNEEIECAPIIKTGFISNKKNPLYEYLMCWNDDTDCIALGYGNLMNHSEQNNCGVEHNYKDETKTFYANRDIKKGEELTINYECKLWFEDVEKKKKNKSRGLV